MPSPTGPGPVGRSATAVRTARRRPDPVESKGNDAGRPQPTPRAGLPALAALAFLMAAVVVVDVWWVLANRRGYPFDIDEAGYLTRALVDAHSLQTSGIAALATHVHGPDPQAPLLPVAAGVVHAATGVGPVGMMVSQQAFVVVLLVSTYCIGHRLGGRAQAVVAAALVAACPGIVDSSRSFGFALVAVAMVTAALAVQLWAGSFDRWPRALAWGGVLGTAALARTMVIGILPGLVLAAVIAASAPGPEPRVRRAAVLAGGLTVAFVVAWSWYSASWQNVVRYLTSFGYGAGARTYGHAVPPWALGWWTTRAATLVDSALLAPVALALVACLVVGAVTRARGPARDAEGAANAAGMVGGEVDGDPVGTVRPSERLLAGLRSPRGSVAVVLAWSYLALSSTANAGSGFVLVLVPPAILLVVAFAATALDGHRRALAALLVALGVVAAASFAADSSTVPTSGPVTVPVAGWRLRVVDPGGSLRAVVTGGAPGGRLPTATVDRYLRDEGDAVRAVAVLVGSVVPPGSAPPVVALATSDPFVNVNSIGLDLLERNGVAPSMTLLRTPGGVVPSVARQVSGAGAPDVVVVGPNAGSRRVRSYLSMDHPMSVVPLLRTVGFRRLGTVLVPDGRTLEVWARSLGAS